MTGVFSAVGWRSALLFSKLTGGRPCVPWSVLWTELTERWEFKFSTPVFPVRTEDAAAGLVEVEAAGNRYWIPAEADRYGLGAMYREVFNPRQPHFYEFRGCRLNAGDVVIDGGACEGFFTRFALSRGARVIAIEPWSRMAAALGRTYAAEIAAGNVIVERALLSDTLGDSRLGFNPDWPFGANEATGELPEGHSEPVPRITVDALMERVRSTGKPGWDGCDFIKMDIEGSEPRAVAGARETVQRFYPALAVAVYHQPTDFRQVLDALRSIRTDYRTAMKGIVQLQGQDAWRPQLLHAWIER